MKNVKNYKGILMILSLFISLSIFTLPVWGAESANVSATVTITEISVSVSDGGVDYGIIGLSSTADTTATGVDDTQVITNGGNVPIDINILGTNTTSWSLSNTAIGADQFMHKYCTSSCDSGGTWTAISTGYTSMVSNIPDTTSNTQDFDLEISTPSSTTDYTQQTTTVTIQASEHTT
jgi:hypothetical protein